MKILFIQPYITVEDPNTFLTEPLGLLSLASYLDSLLHEKVKIKILDLFALGYEQCLKNGTLYRKGISPKYEILRHLNKFNPNIVGITCNFTAYAEDSLEVAKIIKESFPKTFMVMGGAHATMEANSILKNHIHIDCIVRGEGEQTFYELVNAMRNNTYLEHIKGISYRDKNNNIISNADRELLENLDLLPVIDRKYIDIERYKKITCCALPFTKNNPVATIMTTRGCPFNCIFCSTKIMWRRLWRARSPKNVIKEIEYLVNELGYKEIAIQDDQFVLDVKRVHEICDYIIQKKLNISLSIPSGTSIWLVDGDLLKKMKKAGFYRLCFPVETGNQNTLKFIRKPVNLAKVKETIKMANKLGYWTQGNFIIGFPYETKEEIEETIKYAYNSGLDYVIFFVAKPYAGSEMYDIFKKENLLDQIVRSSHIERSDYDTVTLKAQKLMEIHEKAVKGFLIYKLFFYIKPINFFNYLLPKMRTPKDVKYAFKILGVLIKLKVFPIIFNK